MDAENPIQPPKQMCSITIGFVAESDEQAIGVKKKIAAALSDIADIHTRFLLMPITDKGPPHANL